MAQAAEKSLLGVSVVERLGVFLAEQQWRECCNNCLLTLEEAAANASKHAQEKYRQLRHCVEQKLGVSGLPADIYTDMKEHSEGHKAQPSVERSGNISHKVSDSRRADTTHELNSRGSEVKSATQADPLVQAVPLFAARDVGCIPDEDGLSMQSTAESHESGLNRHSGTLQGGADAECPCGLSTPSGRHPAPTCMWKDFRKQWRETTFSDFRSVPASSGFPAAVSARPGGIDFPLVLRDVAAAARCQQQHQSRQQPIDWDRDRLSSSSRNLERSQGGWKEHVALPACGFGVLFPSIGCPTKS